MKIMLNKEMEEELADLIDIFDGCFVNNEEVIAPKHRILNITGY